MAHAATVTVDISGDVARGVAGALGVEAAAGLPKVVAEVRLQGGCGCGCQGDGDSGGGVTIGLRAEDAASLRAALNSFLRWADLAASVSKGASSPMVGGRARPGAKARKHGRGRKGAPRPARRPARRAASRGGRRESAPPRPRSRSSPRRGQQRKR